MISIISGPSSAGKSTLLESQHLGSFVNIYPHSPLVFPGSIIRNQKIPTGGFFFHYNILRVARHIFQNQGNDYKSTYDFAGEPSWVGLQELHLPTRALVLVASRHVLRERMSERNHYEPNGSQFELKKYNKKLWVSVLNSIDLNKLYLAWCRELEKCEIPFTLINSENRKYKVIPIDSLKTLELNS